MQQSIRPPLRWAGSKQKLLPKLLPWLPETLETYIEPFAGSACLAFNVSPARCVLGDLNPHLIEFYERLRGEPEAIHAAYSQLGTTEQAYYAVRARFNASGPSLERAAQFLYLNRYCFNGLYRVNQRAEFNVPWGGAKIGRTISLEELMAASRFLEGSTLVCGDFEAIVDQSLSSNAFVYLDPPYAHDDIRVFREYHHDGFATKDWHRLRLMLERIDKIGAKFLLNYAGDPALIRSIEKWNVGSLDVMRCVGGSRASRGKRREYVASNFELPSYQQLNLAGSSRI